MSFPEIMPARPRPVAYRRQLNLSDGIGWLRLGWKDFKKHAFLSSCYGIISFLAAWGCVLGLFVFDLDYIVFPALAAFILMGPVLALGLYEQSRRISSGQDTGLVLCFCTALFRNFHIFYIAALLMLLAVLWMRSAVLIYALFYGLHPFGPFDTITSQIFTTISGLQLLFVGSCIGGIYAAFSFAVSVISLPMMLDQSVDAFTAMGRSLALVWHNAPVMIAWGGFVLLLCVIGVLTGFAGFIIIFPVLGHATWHLYKDFYPDTGAE